MLTILLGTQLIVVTMTSAYVAYNLTKSKYTNIKLISKCNKTGFKYYKHY